MLLLILFFNNAFSQNIDCESFIGMWITPENDIIEISESDGKYYGKLIFLDKPFDENGKPRKDRHNSNPKLRNRNVEGIVILSNLICKNRTGKLYGDIYLPEEGDSLNCNLLLLDYNTLKITISVNIYSAFEKWERKKIKRHNDFETE